MTLRIGFLGPEGSFTHQTAEIAAVQQGWRGTALVSYRTPPEAVAAVARGDVDVAVVPVATSLRGPLAAENAAIEASGVRRLGEIRRVCRYSLLGLPGAAATELTTVLSHAEAFADCRRHLARLVPGAIQQAVTSTGAAAQRVAHEGRRDWAAIAPAAAARRYGLVVLANNLEDDAENQTTWAILVPNTRNV